MGFCVNAKEIDREIKIQGDRLHDLNFRDGMDYCAESKEKLKKIIGELVKQYGYAEGLYECDRSEKYVPFPETIDLNQLKQALDYLEGIEHFHLMRRGATERPKFDFDESHYREFRAWLDSERTANGS